MSFKSQSEIPSKEILVPGALRDEPGALPLGPGRLAPLPEGYI